MKPTVGRIVHYTSKHGDGVVSPAVVLRTREYAVPQSPTPDAGRWNWPPRDPAPEPVTHGRFTSDC